MPITFQVQSGVQLENDIRFTLEDVPKGLNIKAGGQMITDSDSLAFVYLLEGDSEYHYLKFGQDVYPLLVNTLKATEDPTLQIGDQRIVLVKFKEELEMLIFNIEGNDNYGVEFAQAVENAFKEILKV